MPKFYYRARDAQGNLVEGTKEAVSEDQLVKGLSGSGLFVLDIEEKREVSLPKVPLPALPLNFLQKIKARDIIVFTRQLATMLHAGVAFIDALSVIGEQTENRRLKAVIKEVTQAVKEGALFSKAISKYPHIFNQLYLSMVEVGEASGALEEVLNRIVSIMERDEDTRAKIKSALTYPVIIVIIALGVVGFLTTFVFPKFIAIFQQTGINLPLPTRLLFLFSSLVKKLWFVWLGAIFIALYLLKRYRKTEIGRYTTDKFMLSLPLIGNLTRKIILARFTRTLATLYSSGVPILKSLEIVERGIPNLVLIKILQKIRDDVREGKSLAKPMSQHKEFPPMMVQMIAVGEETGSIADMLNEVSRSYETEVEYALKNLTTAIEPLLIVFMGVIVGFTALSLFLPMFDMMKMVK
ncbi:MAG: type II secretion system F family protein [Candidatus Omnitrophica bacterium]|nr:type II secretion system F family protein [Candidatus Omnitrophota bacterium]MCM8798533.1 type II secretion system F family protein [Candidatus Omnitrophota bacterium]